MVGGGDVVVVESFDRGKVGLGQLRGSPGVKVEEIGMFYSE